MDVQKTTINAIRILSAEAIEKAEQIDGVTVVDKAIEIPVEKLDFKNVRTEAQELWTTLIQRDEENISRLLKKIEIIFGRSIKLSEVTEDQVDLLELMNIEMRDMLTE